MRQFDSCMKNADICIRLTSGAEPSVCVTPESARQELGDVLGLTSAFFVGGGEFRMRRTLAEAMRANRGLLFGRRLGVLVCAADPMATYPLYAHKGRDGVLLFNDFSTLFGTGGAPLKLDHVAVWEGFLYDTTLGERTHFEEVRQLPCCCLWEIGSRGEIRTERYWNFTVEPVPCENSDWLDKGAALFRRYFATFDPDQRFVVTLSGGIDCRLALAFLSEHAPAQNIRAVSYAADDRSYENVLAAEACRVLNVQHSFRRLTMRDYTDWADPFARQTGGLVSIMHGHLPGCLASCAATEGFDGAVLGLYADPAAGYAAHQHADAGLEKSGRWRMVDQWRARLGIPRDVVEGIRGDLQDIWEDYCRGTSVTCFGESFYFVSRTAKMFGSESALLRGIGALVLPYADQGVFEFLLGLPLRLREGKRCIRILMDTFFPRLGAIRDVSSSPRLTTCGDRAHRLRFRFLNNVNAALAVLSRDRLALSNPYHTEAQGPLLRRELHVQLQRAAERLLEAGVISDPMADVIASRHYKPHFYTIQFRALTLAALLDVMEGRAVEIAEHA